MKINYLLLIVIILLFLYIFSDKLTNTINNFINDILNIFNNKKSKIIGSNENEKNKIYYFIEPSNIDPTFSTQSNKIIKESEIYKRYNLQEIFDKNSKLDPLIILKLAKRSSLDKWHDEKEYRSDGSLIRFSFTVQTKSDMPVIYIDDQNWNGVEQSGLSVQEYKNYLILHELMHSLGFDHVKCNDKTIVNGYCPVMYQSSRGPPKTIKSKDFIGCGFIPTTIDFAAPLIQNRYIRNLNKYKK